MVELDRELYLLGGVDDEGQTTRVDVYSPDDDVWSEAAPLPEPVEGLNAVAYEGRIFVLGGVGPGAVWAYDPSNDTWETDLAPRPGGEQRYGAASVGVVDGRIWVAGGVWNSSSTTEVKAYDPGSDTWETGLPALPRQRDGAVGAVIDGVFYVAGGSDLSSEVRTTHEVLVPAAL